MGLIAFGINHKTAPLAVREQAVFSLEKTPHALRELHQLEAVNEAVILSTCNRTELYADSLDPTILKRWLTQYHCLDQELLTPYLYCHQDQHAVRHAMRVASGLDSMVLGEPQILGQLKTAFSLAQKTGTVGEQLGKLFPAVFSVSKKIRTDTAIGANPVSIAYAVINLAKQIFADLAKCSALLIGAGETIELTATHLHSKGIKQLIIANRSLANAQQLAYKFQAQVIAIADIPQYLAQADIIVSATTSQSLILRKTVVAAALRKRKHRPVLMIDMAVPRDIEAKIASLEDVYLYNLDELQNIIADNLKCRHEAAQQAETLIEIQAAHFMRELRALDAATTICAYRERIEQLCATELAIARTQVQQGQISEAVLTETLHRLVQKILHTPSVRLREAAYTGELQLLLAAQKLFDL